MQTMALKWLWAPRPTAINFLTACAAFALVLGLPLRSAEKWKMQYFYDKEGSQVAFTDIQCPSARRCVAAGILQEGKGDKGVVVVTADGGATWKLDEVKEHPISLFFLNENIGWMVTDRGIWTTDETGRVWKKIKDQKDLVRVWFLNENHGFAIGAPKLVLETNDGGHKWTPVPAADAAPSSSEGTTYYWITFRDAEQGIIVGSWGPPQREGVLPDWMVPDRARYRNQYPNLLILLQTLDGGKTWTDVSRSLEGSLLRFRYGPSDYGLALFEYSNAADVPTELVKMDLKTQKNVVLYRNPERAVRDCILLPSGEVILAATERQGKSMLLPIPGKLKMMRGGASSKTWLDMDVDYRAVATRAMLAAPDDLHMWVATDTGMILNLTQQPAP